MGKLGCFLVVCFSLVLLPGCANRASAKVDPDTNFGAIKTMHVVKIPEETAGINVLIAEDLRRRGYVVSTSTEKVSAVDALVTYVDRWMWDITMYLLELTVIIRDPQTDFPLASGNSLHGSLTRLSPPEMVDEVMTNIFKGNAQ
ncbi:MAG: hypothetical protein WC023_09470 [Rhodocyclaceae bacterium]